MKTLMLLTLMVPFTTASAAMYRCGNLYTDDIKVCDKPITLNINATPPQPPDPTRTCRNTVCTITKETK